MWTAVAPSGLTPGSVGIVGEALSVQRRSVPAPAETGTGRSACPLARVDSPSPPRWGTPIAVSTSLEFEAAGCWF